MHCRNKSVTKERNSEQQIQLQKKGNSEQQIRRLQTENELHKRKAQTFYDRKREAKKRAKTTTDFEAIAMDFQKNVYLPNIPTNDVYYLRQLSMYSFNIHVLASSMALFYTYPENLAKKGSDEVCSFLFHFLMNYLQPEVKHLHIFCDSAGGQNKNFSMFRFMHFMVHTVKRLESIKITFPIRGHSYLECLQVHALHGTYCQTAIKNESIKITFPIRGHSYLECDKNMGIVNLKKRMELPDEWYDLLRSSRNKPSPFTVVEVDQGMVKGWSEFFKDKFLRKCPFPTQTIREISCSKEHIRLLSFRSSYNGPWLQQPIMKAVKTNSNNLRLAENEFFLPSSKYHDEDKYMNLQILKGFCENPDAAVYYTQLQHEEKTKKKKKKQKQTRNNTYE
ncbi:hypothetical protein QE152_g1328 [Popillia japonica]|uniref:Transposase n=1 Tax=Popillia japonica TaxID=7064 RepID=A0AAW1N7H3_POPJA